MNITRIDENAFNFSLDERSLVRDTNIALNIENSTEGLETPDYETLPLYLQFDVPYPACSEANTHDHWTVRAKRHKAQRFHTHVSYYQNLERPLFPHEFATITLTRLSPRILDDDNLVSALKYFRDEIADCLLNTHKSTSGPKPRVITGFSDSSPRLRWLYSQQKHKSKLVKITLDIYPHPHKNLTYNPLPK